MNAAFFQQVRQILADAKRDFTPGSPELTVAEQAYTNAGGVPAEVQASSPVLTVSGGDLAPKVTYIDSNGQDVTSEYNPEELTAALKAVGDALIKKVDGKTVFATLAPVVKVGDDAVVTAADLPDVKVFSQGKELTGTDVVPADAVSVVQAATAAVDEVTADPTPEEQQ